MPRNSTKLKNFSKIRLTRSAKEMTKRRPLKLKKPRQMSTESSRIRSTEPRLKRIRTPRNWPLPKRLSKQLPIKMLTLEHSRLPLKT